VGKSQTPGFALFGVAGKYQRVLLLVHLSSWQLKGEIIDTGRGKPVNFELSMVPA